MLVIVLNLSIVSENVVSHCGFVLSPGHVSSVEFSSHCVVVFKLCVLAMLVSQ